MVKRIIKCKNTVPTKYECLLEEQKRQKLRNRMSRLINKNINKSQESLDKLKSENEKSTENLKSD